MECENNAIGIISSCLILSTPCRDISRKRKEGENNAPLMMMQPNPYQNQASQKEKEKKRDASTPKGKRKDTRKNNLHHPYAMFGVSDLRFPPAQ
jgi:hypothetical protein